MLLSPSVSSYLLFCCCWYGRDLALNASSYYILINTVCVCPGLGLIILRSHTVLYLEFCNIPNLTTACFKCTANPSSAFSYTVLAGADGLHLWHFI